ncbi:reverse transcriptase domain-containing protein [Tanacetum coccineum]
MSATAIEKLITQLVANALLTYEENRNIKNRKGNGNDNGNGSHDSGSGGRTTLHTARVCTYKEFLNCQPLNFKGTEGANVATAYTAGPNEKKEYARTLPLCNKCKLHHNGSCTVKYANCKKVGHMTRDYRSPSAAADQRTLTCFECKNQGHYRSECPKLKNQNCGNQTGNGKSCGRMYTLGRGEADQDPNNITNDIDA